MCAYLFVCRHGVQAWQRDLECWRSKMEDGNSRLECECRISVQYLILVVTCSIRPYMQGCLGIQPPTPEIYDPKDSTCFFT